MNAAPNEQHLPASAGGLIDLALGAVLGRAPLYALLSLVLFALCGIVQLAWRTSSDADLAVKMTAIAYLEIVGLSYIIAVAALDVGTRAAGERPSTRTLLEAAVVRYLPVLAAMMAVTLIVDVTTPFSALGPLPDQPALLILTAPLTWFLWGVVNLAGPYAALSRARALVALFEAFGHAIGAAMRPQNLPRLCLVAFVNVIPNLLGDVLYDALSHRGIAAAAFWSSVPLDVLSVVPIAALQTAFALDFARRAAAADRR